MHKFHSCSLQGRILFPVVACVLAVGLAGCDDFVQTPVDEETREGSGLVTAIPELPGGLSPGIRAALEEAFGQIDRIRLLVQRVEDGTILVEGEVSVAPGEESPRITARVPVRGSAQAFEITVEGFRGETQLFRSEPAVAEVTGSTEADPPPTLVTVQLTYTGPGRSADALELTPAERVLAPGGASTLSPTVRNPDGSPVEGVPVGWASEDASVATVSQSGEVTGVGEGWTRVRATTPTGVEGAARIYVAEGEVAFIRGGGLRIAPVGSAEMEDAAPGVQGARGPAWSPDGTTLYYEVGGTVRTGAGAALTEGSWPQVSPDGTKLVVAQAGRAVFVNEDGTEATQGPQGQTPTWHPDGAHLMVGGGSVERVRADGEGRQVVVPDPGARWPAVGPDGRLSWVQDGALFVHGAGGAAVQLMGPEWGVNSRPAWSRDGRWLVAEAAGTLMLVPSGGQGPPAALPVGEGRDPAWRGSGAQRDPEPLQVLDMSPERPVVGEVVTFSGSGFDWIIPANNEVLFPERDQGAASATSPTVSAGFRAGEVVSVTPESLSVLVPSGIGPGDVRVRTRVGEAQRSFLPALGRVEVQVLTTSGHPVEGAAVGLLDAGGQEAASGVTDGEGRVVLEELDEGSYQLQVSPPEGYEEVAGQPDQVAVEWGATTTVESNLRAQVMSLLVTPSDPTLAVGQAVDMEAQGVDIQGNPVTDVASSSWVAVEGGVTFEVSGLSASLIGQHPSDLEGHPFEVQVEDITERFHAIVTSRIDVEVTGPDGPVRNLPVRIRRGEDFGAVAPTNFIGEVGFSDLFAGTYSVRVDPPAGRSVEPSAEQMVTLGPESPTAEVSFRFAEFAILESFEDGIPEDWETQGMVLASQEVPNLAPTHGDWFAFLRTPGVVSLPFGGTGGSTLRSAPFSAAAGAVLSFDFNFVTTDGGSFSDFAFVQLRDAETDEVVATVANANTRRATDRPIPATGGPAPVLSEGVTLEPAEAFYDGIATGPLDGVTFGPGKFGGGPGGSTGWVTSTFTIPDSGTYTLFVVVQDVGNRAFASGVALDNIELGSGPGGP